MVKNILIVGPPGGGKTSEADLLAEQYQLAGWKTYRFDMGNELRERSVEGTLVSQALSNITSSGNPTPVAFVTGEWMKLYSSIPQVAEDEKVVIIMSGTIRLVQEAHNFIEAVSYFIDELIVVRLDVSQKICKQRMGGQTNRNDSAKKSIAKRFRVYKDTVKAVQVFHRRKEKWIKYCVVDASKTKEQVLNAIIVAVSNKEANLHLAGDVGVGKSSALLEIKKMLPTFNHFSTGTIARKAAENAGYTSIDEAVTHATQYYEQTGRIPDHDKTIDDALVIKIKTTKVPTIYDSRMCSYFMNQNRKNCFSFLLTCSAQTVAERRGTTVEEVEKRRTQDNIRYEGLYNYKINDASNYGGSISSEHYSPTEIAERIVSNFLVWLLMA